MTDKNIHLWSRHNGYDMEMWTYLYNIYSWAQLLNLII